MYISIKDRISCVYVYISYEKPFFFIILFTFNKFLLKCFNNNILHEKYIFDTGNIKQFSIKFGTKKINKRVTL